MPIIRNKTILSGPGLVAGGTHLDIETGRLVKEVPGLSPVAYTRLRDLDKAIADAEAEIAYIAHMKKVQAQREEKALAKALRAIEGKKNGERGGGNKRQRVQVRDVHPADTVADTTDSNERRKAPRKVRRHHHTRG